MHHQLFIGWKNLCSIVWPCQGKARQILHRLVDQGPMMTNTFWFLIQIFASIFINFHRRLEWWRWQYLMHPSISHFLYTGCNFCLVMWLIFAYKPTYSNSFACYCWHIHSPPRFRMKWSVDCAVNLPNVIKSSHHMNDNCRVCQFIQRPLYRFLDFAFMNTRLDHIVDRRWWCRTLFLLPHQHLFRFVWFSQSNCSRFS